MAKSLVIVESKTKTKTIGRFLGKDYTVLSSVGHVKDLPKGRIGVDPENGFEPEYVTIRGKGKVLSEIRRAAVTSEKVFIATDPDREGEAIAHHLAEEMKAKKGKVYRVLFNEITERAVKNAIANPIEIDRKKVEAQKARRVVDRLVGYQVSPILWRTVYRGLSAGRVQSVALRLICEREDGIDIFVPKEYWSITAELQGEKTQPFLSKLIKIDEKALELGNETETSEIVADIKQQIFKITDIRKKKLSRNPKPPFTTSTMQQIAANRFGYSSKKIMMIAQQLYEGVELGEKGSTGLITYMRTDSTRVSSEALLAVREHIIVNYGKEYLPDSARKFKVKSSAQDAHEAIRPTSLKRDPKSVKRFLTTEQFKLYELIWNRFVASQMEAAKMEQTTIDIMAGERCLFRTTGTATLFRGFLQVYEESKEGNTSGSGDDNMRIPIHVKVGDVLKLIGLKPEQHFTKPSPRYTESSLVKELDALNIGRPSTYAVIISTIQSRKYVEKNQRQLLPTELGRTINKILIQNFDQLFNVKFTAHMEEDLDKIESGQKGFLEVAQEFYTPFKAALENVSSRQAEIKDSLQEETSEKCPKCKSELIIRWGRNGKFMACSAYPECKHTQPLEEPETIDEKCENCGKGMVIKFGRFGRFLACSGYPDCKTARPLSIGVDCPKEDCEGYLVEKKSKKGRVFFGCSKYPKCKFASWNRPVPVKCSQCESPYVEKRYSQSNGEYLYCPACKAQFTEENEGTYREAAYG